MRRRVKGLDGGPAPLPPQLRTFVRVDWPGANDAEAYSAWFGAREDWKTAHGVTELPDDEAVLAAFPDEPWDGEAL